MVRAIAVAMYAMPLLSGAAFAGSIIQVPEPASLGLLAVGAGALLIARFRK